MAVYVLVMHYLNVSVYFLVPDQLQHLLILLNHVYLFSYHFCKVNLNHCQLSFQRLWDLT